MINKTNFVIVSLSLFALALTPTLIVTGNQFLAVGQKDIQDQQQKVKPDKEKKPDKVKPEKPEKPEKVKKDKKGKDKGCSLNKILVQVSGLTPVLEGNQTVAANLQGFDNQEKVVEANETDVAFNFMFGKKAEFCPAMGDILFGWVITDEQDIEYTVEVTGSKNIKTVVDASLVQLG